MFWKTNAIRGTFPLMKEVLHAVCVHLMAPPPSLPFLILDRIWHPTLPAVKLSSYCILKSAFKRLFKDFSGAVC